MKIGDTILDVRLRFCGTYQDENRIDGWTLQPEAPFAKQLTIHPRSLSDYAKIIDATAPEGMRRLMHAYQRTRYMRASRDKARSLIRQFDKSIDGVFKQAATDASPPELIDELHALLWEATPMFEVNEGDWVITSPTTFARVDEIIMRIEPLGAKHGGGEERFFTYRVRLYARQPDGKYQARQNTKIYPNMVKGKAKGFEDAQAVIDFARNATQGFIDSASRQIEEGRALHKKWTDERDRLLAKGE